MGNRDNSRRPVILSYDMISCLGTDLEQQWTAAETGSSGIGSLTRFPLREDFPVTVAGEVPAFDRSPYPFLGQRKMAHWTSPIFENSMLVVHRALERAGLEITEEIAPRTAITFSSAVGGQDAVINADRIMVERGRLPHPFTNPNSCINMVGGKVSILTGATGPILSTITACATGCTSMMVAALLFDGGMADLCLCGAADSALVEPIVAGFATMNGAYKTKAGAFEEPPDRASRPFSANRRGFVISEGAGCVLLATREFADAHGLPYKFELAGWSSTSDAKHFVAPNPATVTRCMGEALAHAGVAPGEVDAVNAHAASTKVGDAVEASSLEQVFGKDLPPVTANKSFLGHAMGAASAVESILALEGMERGILPPTINYTEDPEIHLDCVSDGPRPQQQRVLLKNAFGFGGCNACLVFRRID